MEYIVEDFAETMAEEQPLKISVITVCFNSDSTIRDTIASVACQTYGNVEHIVVDGGSADRTMEVVCNAQSVSILVSEPDRGIYDAMNKGIAMASGDVIGFLNADDIYAGSDVLEQVAKAFEDTEMDACYGDLIYVDPQDTGRAIRYWQSSPYVEGCFQRGWMPPHPTFFARRSVYEQCGNFDLTYTLAADVELMMRLLAGHRICTRYLSRVMIRMRLGGVTNKNLPNIYRQNCEVMQALAKNGMRTGWLRFIVRKLLARSVQFIRRPK